jgi:hypothetical protein
MTYWHVQPHQASHGAKLCIMHGDKVVAVTPGNTHEDQTMAAHMVLALNVYDEEGEGDEHA